MISGGFQLLRPFSGRSSIAEFARLVSFIGFELDNTTFVENLLRESDKVLLIQSVTQWKVKLRKEFIIHYGLRLYTDRNKAEYSNPGNESELVDVERVKLRLDDLPVTGCLLCRKAAVHRLLQGCEIQWESKGFEVRVHKFVENTVTDHWSWSKLRMISGEALKDLLSVV